MKTNQTHSDSAKGAAHQNPGNRGVSFAAYGNLAQLATVIQMAITDEVQIAVSGIKQPTSNVCWAASGWCIHIAKGGANYSSLRNFVQGQGNASTLQKFDNDQIHDIDKIIGGGSNTKHLKSSDNSGDFSKAVITREINAGRPILANVNNNHYVVICGKRKNNKAYEIEIMDPATGSCSWVSTSSGSDNSHISTAGVYTLSVLYYT